MAPVIATKVAVKQAEAVLQSLFQVRLASKDSLYSLLHGHYLCPTVKYVALNCQDDVDDSQWSNPIKYTVIPFSVYCLSWLSSEYKWQAIRLSTRLAKEIF